VVNGPYANKRDGASELAVALERRYGSLHGAKMTLEVESTIALFGIPRLN